MALSMSYYWNDALQKKQKQYSEFIFMESLATTMQSLPFVENMASFISKMPVRRTDQKMLEKNYDLFETLRVLALCLPKY